MCNLLKMEDILAAFRFAFEIDSTETSTTSEDNSQPSNIKETCQEPELSDISSIISTSDDHICTICLEPWAISGPHELVSLRCGHLYGRSCVSKWLTGHANRCPNCNAFANKYSILKIYAGCVKLLDTSEQDKALADLSQDQRLCKQARMRGYEAETKCLELEKKCNQTNAKLQMVTKENERLRKKLAETQKKCCIV